MGSDDAGGDINRKGGSGDKDGVEGDCRYVLDLPSRSATGYRICQHLSM